MCEFVCFIVKENICWGTCEKCGRPQIRCSTQSAKWTVIINKKKLHEMAEKLRKDYNSLSAKWTTLRQCLIFASVTTRTEEEVDCRMDGVANGGDGMGPVKLAFNSFLALDRRINWQLLVGCNIFPFRWVGGWSWATPAEKWWTADVGECYKINKTYINIIRAKQYLIANAGEGGNRTNSCILAFRRKEWIYC